VVALAYLIGMTLPVTAAICRRLVDLQVSRWWAMLLIIPVLGLFVLLIITLRAGKIETEQTGYQDFDQVTL
jgi:uncharacterized membrane protein YhaH (DUF805 family)